MNPRVVAIALVVIFGACLSTYTISASGDPRTPLFVIEQEIGCAGADGEIRVHRMTLEDGRLVETPVWTAQKEQKSDYVRIRQFTYGVLPPGWREFAGAAPLELGQKYRVRLNCPPTSGVGNFRIGGTRERLVIENFDWK